MFEQPPGFQSHFAQSSEMLSMAVHTSNINHPDSVEALAKDLAWIHSIIQSKRETSEWKENYTFTISDLHAALQLALKDWNIRRGSIDWKSVCGMLREVIYGAIIEEPSDRKVNPVDFLPFI